MLAGRYCPNDIGKTLGLVHREQRDATTVARERVGVDVIDLVAWHEPTKIGEWDAHRHDAGRGVNISRHGSARARDVVHEPRLRSSQ